MLNPIEPALSHKHSELLLTKQGHLYSVFQNRFLLKKVMALSHKLSELLLINQGHLYSALQNRLLLNKVIA
jgi:hypothetical protein